MSLPFSEAQFLDTLGRYNRAVWPAQGLLFSLGALAAVRACRRRPHAGRDVGIILAVLWGWMGIAYHLAFFRTINAAASLFAGAFVLQALLFAWAALSSRR